MLQIATNSLILQIATENDRHILPDICLPDVAWRGNAVPIVLVDILISFPKKMIFLIVGSRASKYPGSRCAFVLYCTCHMISPQVRTIAPVSQLHSKLVSNIKI